MRISDWSSDVCSSDLESSLIVTGVMRPDAAAPSREENQCDRLESRGYSRRDRALHARRCAGSDTWRPDRHLARDVGALEQYRPRSEEHTSELQSLMRISYAVFCLKKKNTTHDTK